MADNIAVTPGSGATIAADDVGGALHQRVKVEWGTDGTVNETDTASGKPLPVQLRSSTGADFVKAEDAAAAGGDFGIPALAIQLATPADTASDGDYAMLQMSSGRIWVDASGKTLTVASHAVTNAGTFAVQVDGNALTALQKIDDPVLVDDAAFTPATSSVAMAGFQADESSTDSVDEGDAGAARMTLDRKIIVTNQPHTAGGLSVFRSLDLDESEEEVKGTPGCLYKLRLTNRATTARYVKLYNDTAANVVVGSAMPIDTIIVPGASSADTATVLTENFGGYGLTFSAALCLAATTGLADADTGAPSANDVVATAYYK